MSGRLVLLWTLCFLLPKSIAMTEELRRSTTYCYCFLPPACFSMLGDSATADNTWVCPAAPTNDLFPSFGRPAETHQEAQHPLEPAHRPAFYLFQLSHKLKVSSSRPARGRSLMETSITRHHLHLPSLISESPLTSTLVM